MRAREEREAVGGRCEGGRAVVDSQGDLVFLGERESSVPFE